ncbi:MAG: hypothetical protein JO257_01100, partial [Deltaproteobacteria bacterium]|nr:hypothetical protein [Deltaproteobacteria bacterium]
MRWLALAAAGCGFHARAAALDGSSDAPADGARHADASRDGSMPLPDAPPPPIAFRQIKNTEGQNLMNVTVTLAQPVVAGDLLVVFVGWYKAGTVSSVADTGNDAFGVAVGPTPSGTETQTIYYACGATGAAAETVTVRFASNNQDPDVRVVDYSGLAPTACLDVAQANTGAGTAIDSGALATTTARDLLVAGDFQVNMTATGDAQFTQRQISGFGDLVEDRVVTT